MRMRDMPPLLPSGPLIRVYPLSDPPYDKTVMSYDEISTEIGTLDVEGTTIATHSVERPDGSTVAITLRIYMDESGRRKNLARNHNAPAYLGIVAIGMYMEKFGKNGEVELPNDGYISYAELFTASNLDSYMLARPRILELQTEVMMRRNVPMDTVRQAWISLTRDVQFSEPMVEQLMLKLGW